MIPLVDLKRQTAMIRSEIDRAIAEVIDSGIFIGGQRVKQFEKNFSRYCGADYGVGTSSGTTALQLALAALGVGPGDEVITVSHTFIATAEAITACGATIRWVDVDPKTYTMDPNALAQAITPQTRVVLPVAIYGQLPDMTAILELTRSHGIAVVLDAAQAHGATWLEQPVGDWADVSCFSFFPGKNLGAFGDAGMAVTSDERLAKKMHMLANHGRTEKYRHDCVGFNFRLDPIQAAVLDVKLPYLNQWTRARQALAERYDFHFQKTAAITPCSDPRAGHVYHLYVLQIDERDELLAHLKTQGISAGIHYPIPVHEQPAYQFLNYTPNALPMTQVLAKRIISLPLFPGMTEKEVDTVAAAVKDAILAARC